MRRAPSTLRRSRSSFRAASGSTGSSTWSSLWKCRSRLPPEWMSSPDLPELSMSEKSATAASEHGQEHLATAHDRDGEVTTASATAISFGEALIAETKRRLFRDSVPRIHRCLAVLSEE